MAKEEAIEIDGIVENVLPNSTFRVHLPNGHFVLAPRCPACRLALKFGTDRNGRTTESCGCGYGAYLQTRGGRVSPPGLKDAS